MGTRDPRGGAGMLRGLRMRQPRRQLDDGDPIETEVEETRGLADDAVALGPGDGDAASIGLAGASGLRSRLRWDGEGVGDEGDGGEGGARPRWLEGSGNEAGGGGLGSEAGAGTEGGAGAGAGVTPLPSLPALRVKGRPAEVRAGLAGGGGGATPGPSGGETRQHARAATPPDAATPPADGDPYPQSPPERSEARLGASGGAAVAVHRRLAAEVCRKLELATRAEGREDRDIIAGEVFADVTGDLSSAARERTGALYRRWYEVLAPHFCRDWGAAEALLGVCRRLWGQPFTAPIFALLLHQWLLVHDQAGGEDQRLKHLNVLASGARSLFLGDVETGNRAFAPLYHFIAERVVFLPSPPSDAAGRPAEEADADAPGPAGDAKPGPPAGLPPSPRAAPARGPPTPSPDPPEATAPGSPGGPGGGADAPGEETPLSPVVAFYADMVPPAARARAREAALARPQTRREALPPAAREALDALVAGFLPYYAPRGQLGDLLLEFPPSPDAPAAVLPRRSRGAEGPGAAGDEGAPAPRPDLSGAERAMDRAVDVLSRDVRTQAGTLAYLRALASLRDWPHLAQLRTATRVRLQGELYALTQPGGPRYASRRVNRESLAALDGLFPAGRRVRRAVSVAFRTLHPQEWPWAWWDVACDSAGALADAARRAWLALLAWLAAAWARAPARARPRPPARPSPSRWAAAFGTARLWWAEAAGAASRLLARTVEGARRGTRRARLTTPAPA